jgi:hypothetical protein
VVMNYLARAFAEQGLRVYVPDLPGMDGRRARSHPNKRRRALSLLRGLAARGLLIPDHTVIAGLDGSGDCATGGGQISACRSDWRFRYAHARSTWSD